MKNKNTLPNSLFDFYFRNGIRPYTLFFITWCCSIRAAAYWIQCGFPAVYKMVCRII